jgi:hypothetical protein
LFPPEEDLEEARRSARLDSFRKGPEVMARQRLVDLRDKKRVADSGGPPLTAAQKTMFRFLALLYPSPPRPSPSQEMIEAHPFSTRQLLRKGSAKGNCECDCPPEIKPLSLNHT